MSYCSNLKCGKFTFNPKYCSIECTKKSQVFKIRVSDKKAFSKNSTFPRQHLKARILKKKLIEYICAICGIDSMWQNKPMPLILDHINGINNDNRLKNLRFVCSNCDSQLDTYKNKRGYKRTGRYGK